MGYTPELVLGVWVGFDDGKSLGLSGAQAALPIFARLLNATDQEDGRGFTVPEDLEVESVDQETGLTNIAACGGENEYFLPGTAPMSRGDCWEEFPQWVSEAGSRAVSGIRGFLGRIFGRRRQAH